MAVAKTILLSRALLVARNGEAKPHQEAPALHFLLVGAQPARDGHDQTNQQPPGRRNLLALLQSRLQSSLQDRQAVENQLKLYLKVGQLPAALPCLHAGGEQKAARRCS